MIDIIIPSLDRPAQLDLLLRSLLRYWKYSDLHINVLYKYSSEAFSEGYNKLFEKHWYVVPVLEYDFGRQIISLLDKSLVSVLGFFTDDCVVFRDPILQPNHIGGFFDWYKPHCISLRLGKNTVVQNYLTGELQPALSTFYRMVDYSQLIHYLYKRYYQYSNYGYLFSWDGCFYNKVWLKEVLVGRRYENPRALEHQLNSDLLIRQKANPKMICMDTSSVFVNTINAVQNQDIPSGTKYSYTPQELNEKWLDGYEISLDSFDNLDIISCHEEYPLIFNKGM